VPELQRPELGAEETVPPLLAPQAPSTDTSKFAEQLADDPPFSPAQVHVQGPLPETVLAVPKLQSPELGAEETVPPLLAPQAPLTDTDEFAEQLVASPPF